MWLALLPNTALFDKAGAGAAGPRPQLPNRAWLSPLVLPMEGTELALERPVAFSFGLLLRMPNQRPV